MTTICCPHCGKDFELDQVLTHTLQEQLRTSLSKEYQNKLASELERLQVDKAEQEKTSKQLREQITQLIRELSEARRQKDEAEIAAQRKLLLEQEKIVAQVRQKADEEHHLKDLEKEKKLQDALQQLDQMKQKIEQGSQQTQGEVLELELEKILRLEFPSDLIDEVKKGERGADIIHTVIDRLGRTCGVILWESKNAKWSEGWVAKLKEDQRAKKADLAILVSMDIPHPDQKIYSYRDGIWITSWAGVVPLASALRFNLVNLHHQKVVSIGKNEKAEILHQYITGSEFLHRVSAMAESFSALQSEIEAEKRHFASKWNRQEKEIRKFLDNIYGMQGDLQGIIGASLSDIKLLPLTNNTQTTDANTK